MYPRNCVAPRHAFSYRFRNYSSISIRATEFMTPSARTRGNFTRWFAHKFTSRCTSREVRTTKCSSVDYRSDGFGIVRSRWSGFNIRCQCDRSRRASGPEKMMVTICVSAKSESYAPWLLDGSPRQQSLMLASYLACTSHVLSAYLSLCLSVRPSLCAYFSAYSFVCLFD